MAARSAAAASTKANSSQHRAEPSRHDEHRVDAPQEPRALRDWKWRKDPEAVDNPCYKGDGRGGTGYVNLREGDLVWTGQCPGTPPKTAQRWHTMEVRIKPTDGKIRMVPMQLCN